MPKPYPERDRKVYLVGAGVSSALGLPNTPSLLLGVLELSRTKQWLISEDLPERLDRAFKFFYPDARFKGFRPDVVDFFSTLRTYLDVGEGFRGTGFTDGPDLFRSLKFAIAHLLIEQIRQIDERLRTDGHPYLDEMLRPGNIVITCNWDFLLERYAEIRRIPLRLSTQSSTEVTLLKLHGSIDWCQVGSRKAGRSDADYASLRERIIPAPVRRVDMTRARGGLIRIRALENWNDCWRKVKSRATDLHMVTMVRGKGGDLGPLRDVWRDAFGALSRAKLLEIVGYSMPPDDVEVRTLLRAGIGRGEGPPRIVIRNPSPDVHVRIRRYLEAAAESNFMPVNAL